MKNLHKNEMYGNSKPMRLAYDIVKQLNGLSLEDAEKTARYISERAFMVNRNKCIREGKDIFEATISADF